MHRDQNRSTKNFIQISSASRGFTRSGVKRFISKSQFLFFMNNKTIIKTKWCVHSVLCHCEYLNDSFMQIIDVKSIFYKYCQTNVIFLLSIKPILFTAAKPFSAEFTNKSYFMILTFQNDRIISYTLFRFSLNSIVH